MAMTTHVDIVSAEEAIFSGTAEMVYAPAEMGEVGIAPRHTQMITRLKPGEVRLQTGDQEQSFYVSGGILEVQPHVVTVLADSAIRADDLDEAQALEAERRAREILEKREGDIDLALAEAELSILSARLDWLKKKKKH